MKKIVGSLVLAASVAFGGVLATVNGEEISSDTLNEYVSLITKGKMSYEQLPKEQQNKILDSFLDSVVMVQQADKEGVTKDEEYKKSYDIIVKDLKIKTWVKKKLEAMNPTAKEIQAFYDKNKDTYFKEGEEVRASHILVKDEKMAKEAIAEINAAKDKKATFEKIAQEKSTCPSKAKGGDLGFFTADKMVKPFSEAAFALQKGEYTKTPVKTRFGYHVIYVTDKKTGGYKTLTEVKDKIIEFLKREMFQAEIKKIKSHSKIIYK